MKNFKKLRNFKKLKNFKNFKKLKEIMTHNLWEFRWNCNQQEWWWKDDDKINNKKLMINWWEKNLHWFENLNRSLTKHT